MLNAPSMGRTPVLASALALTAFLATAASALGQATTPAPAAATAAAQKAAIDVSEAWTRATPGRATNAAIYMRIVNAGRDADALNGVETDTAQRAMVHSTTTAGGVSQMNMMPALAIPRASTVTLAPGGSHVMLEGLKAPLRAGESFIVTLVFAKAGKISATVKVVDAAARGPGPDQPVTPAPPQPGPDPNDR